MNHLDMHRNFKLLTEMLYIRMVEESLAERYHEQEMRCPMHLCIGQEAIAAGVSSSLLQSDHVFSGHRAHGHYLAKGGDLGRMFAELYGRILDAALVAAAQCTLLIQKQDSWAPPLLLEERFQ